MLPLEPGVAGAPGAHEARTDGGHLDAVRGQLRPQPLRQADQRELAGAVGQEMGHAHAAADRCHVDDPSRAAGAHRGQHGQGRVQRAPEVGVHRAMEVLQAHLPRGSDRDGARAVHQRVDRSQPVGGGSHQPLHRDRVGHVARDGRDRPAPLRQIPARPVERFLVARAHGHPSALGHQLARDQEAEPAGAAGDQHRTTAQVPPSPVAPEPPGRQEAQSGQRHRGQGSGSSARPRGPHRDGSITTFTQSSVLSRNMR